MESQLGTRTSTEQPELDDNIPTLTKEEIKAMEGREKQSQPPTYGISEVGVTKNAEKSAVSNAEESAGKASEGMGNAPVPTKPGGGSNPNDFVNPHSEKHMYDPSRPSTRNRSQYGEDVDVGKLRQETMTNMTYAVQYTNW
ncbi:hypothetical protein [Paenibacillus popilliae]|uniref:Hydrolase n=1 Tax=Paenibacillus popilliae ATCC 14706 TaxID=1212764 RepID=M9M2Y4_PAEPP|nr:hypothetical protein [Paenibacillus popilliae]GAC43359.1 hydrolase [Paenibacillus popilliae ATCC 14706]